MSHFMILKAYQMHFASHSCRMRLKTRISNCIYKTQLCVIIQPGQCPGNSSGHTPLKLGHFWVVIFHRKLRGVIAIPFSTLHQTQLWPLMAHPRLVTRHLWPQFVNTLLPLAWAASEKIRQNPKFWTIQWIHKIIISDRTKWLNIAPKQSINIPTTQEFLIKFQNRQHTSVSCSVCYVNTVP